MKRALTVLALLLPAAALAKPLDPGIDAADRPFCYFSRPSTVLGEADHDDGTQVTPEGWLWTGSVQLLFFTGDTLTPLRERLQSLRDECLPIVTQRTRQGAFEYEITRFAATLEGSPESPLVNFIRVRVRNTGAAPATAVFATGVRADGDHCCERLRRPFSLLTARYELVSDGAVRDGQLLYRFPTEPAPRRLILPDREGCGPVTGREEGVVSRAPVCLVRYDLPLPAGGEKTLDFQLPSVPVELTNTPLCTALRAARYDDYLQRTLSWWHDYLAEGLQLELPEAKVADTFRASLMYDTIAREKIGDQYLPTVNHLQYHYFWVRDGAYIVNAFDLAGRHRWAEQCLDHFLKCRQPDGIICQPPQWDGYGQTLWAFGSHWRLTGDLDWARRMYPSLADHVCGIRAKFLSDPLGLVPAAPPYDNEAINGHYTGHSFWVLIGLRDAVAMAEALGYKAEAAQFEQWRQEYEANFLKALGAATERTGGYIPPGLDAPEGCDWDNLISLYPRGGVPARGALPLSDARIGTTLDTVRQKKYAEGLLTYGRGLKVGLLHQYDTIKATEGLVALNRQQEALADLYAILVHTSSAQAGFEFGVAPWDNRDSGGNFPPHGWFAAEYMGLLRNMLLREWDGDLHLLSVVSPRWLREGDRISVRRAPTDFGPVSFTATVRGARLTLRLTPHWRTPPARVILHLPWFLACTEAAADGKRLALSRPEQGEGRQVVLPADTREVIVQWRPDALPALSYDRAVAAWKAEYRRHFAAFTAAGGTPEPLWREAEYLLTREQRQQAWADLQARSGIAVGCSATASHSEPGHSPAAAADGDLSRNSYWGATPYPAWWQVDLGQVRRIDRVRVITYWDEGSEGRSYAYQVRVSSDGAAWQTVADLQDNTQPARAAGRSHSFPAVAARYVRVQMLRNSANTGVHLAEVLVFAAVEAPVVAGPDSARCAWSAATQSGTEPEDMPGWGYTGAERIILQGKQIQRAGDAVRLVLRGGESEGAQLADLSIGQVQSGTRFDLIPGTRTPVTCSGQNTFTLPAGRPLVTDWVKFRLEPGKDYAVTLSVLGPGATTLWSARGSLRLESTDATAPTAAAWSRLPHSEPYNVYFLERVEVP